MKSDLRKQFDGELANYAAAARATLSRNRKLKRACVGFSAAGSVALVGGNALEANIVYNGPHPINVMATTNSVTASTQIDIDGDGQNDFNLGVHRQVGSIAFPPGYANSFSGFISAIANTVGTGAIATAGSVQTGTPGSIGATFLARRFNSGTSVGGPASTLGPSQQRAVIGGQEFLTVFGSTFVSNNFNAGFTSNPGFLGVQLAGGNYAWIQVHYQPNSNLQILDWAYDNMGNHIPAGLTVSPPPPPMPPPPPPPTGTPVPEPTSAALFVGLGLMSMGAAGVRELRRRKRDAADAAV